MKNNNLRYAAIGIGIAFTACTPNELEEQPTAASLHQTHLEWFTGDETDTQPDNDKDADE